MQIESVPIESVKPYWRNPRKTDAAVEPVAESIRRYGFNQPILVDENGIVISGHTRLRAARSLGMEAVPVCTLDISKEDAKAFRLADNATAEIARWDYAKLKGEFDKTGEGSMKAFFSPEELESMMPTEKDVELAIPTRPIAEPEPGSFRTREVTCPECLKIFKVSKNNA